MSAHEAPTHNSHPSGYEKRDVNVLFIGGVALGIILLIIVMGIVVDQYFIISRERDYYEMVLKPENPQLDSLHQSENQRLHQYQLVDSAKGIWRIPIDSAMALQAAQAKQDQSNPQSSVTQSISHKKSR